MPVAESIPSRFPSWLRVKLPVGENYERIKKVSASRNLHTVCEEARCPNIAECWGAGTATFMVLGELCTRGCRFCSVSSALKPPPPDPLEPQKLAQTIQEMKLGYIVLTTVCRDDLPDQGASHIAQCIKSVRRGCPNTKIEVLMQDFRGDKSLIARVLEAGPDVAAHNLETVRRLSPAIRDAKAGYEQSLEVLSYFREILPQTPTKSSLLLGIRETEQEVLESLRDLRSVGVSMVTLGQYLRPDSSGRNLPVYEFLSPERFDFYADCAREMGFSEIAAGPLVRSSYHAGELFLKGLKTDAS